MAGVDRKVAQDFGVYFLDDIICWVSRELEPAVLYEPDTLRDVVAALFTPGDVFPKSELETWAETHGFTREVT